jgi:tetratricopeptide (TPR) repeat protein
VNEDEMDIDLIERYHKGLLKDSELDEFFKRERNDKDFAQSVRSYKGLMEGIEYFGKQKDFADTIRQWEEEIREPHKKKHSETVTLSPEISEAGEEKGRFFIDRRNIYWLAAAVVSLLIVSAVFLLKPVTPDAIALYETYYQPYPNVFDPTVRGEIDTLTVSRKAFMAYNEGDYHTAAGYFKELLNSDDPMEKDNARLYLGNCYLSIGSVAAAKETLLQISAQSHVADQAKWYLALAYLKSNDMEQAEKALRGLTDHPNSYQEKANKILRDLTK